MGTILHFRPQVNINFVLLENISKQLSVSSCLRLQHFPSSNITSLDTLWIRLTCGSTKRPYRLLLRLFCKNQWYYYSTKMDLFLYSDTHWSYEIGLWRAQNLPKANDNHACQANPIPLPIPSLPECIAQLPFSPAIGSGQTITFE